jgi:hypothetical protein
MTSADVSDDDAQPIVHVRCAPPRRRGMTDRSNLVGCTGVPEMWMVKSRARRLALPHPSLIRTGQLGRARRTDRVLLHAPQTPRTR